jgi:hypothetical protein
MAFLRKFVLSAGDFDPQIGGLARNKRERWPHQLSSLNLLNSCGGYTHSKSLKS